jgi:hypothetical protein
MARGYTFAEMRHALEVGWGEVGGRVAQAWADFNNVYFGRRLKPLPIFLTPATPYGKRVAWTCCGGPVTHIALCAPKRGTVLVADRDTLLHEMIHQFLHEAGEDTKHAGEPWCREVMRLHKQITGKEIWAGKYTVMKKRVGGRRVSVRVNLPRPGTGEPSIPQAEIARWPHGSGIALGAL